MPDLFALREFNHMGWKRGLFKDVLPIEDGDFWISIAMFVHCRVWDCFCENGDE